MGGQRVAGEEDVDVAGAHQPDHRRGRAGVHDAGPPTQRIRWPAALTSRIRSAIWRTSSACGFSLDTAEDMKPKSSSSPQRAGGRQLDPDAVRPAHDRLAGPHVADRHGADDRPPSSSTTSPQSISGRSTGSHSRSSRTKVSRLVVE